MTGFHSKFTINTLLAMVCAFLFNMNAAAQIHVDEAMQSLLAYKQMILDIDDFILTYTQVNERLSLSDDEMDDYLARAKSYEKEQTALSAQAFPVFSEDYYRKEGVSVQRNRLRITPTTVECAQMKADGELFNFTEQKEGVLHRLKFIGDEQDRFVEESQIPLDRVGDARFHYCFFSWGYAFLQQATNWDAPIHLDNVLDDGTVRLKCEVGDITQCVTLMLDLQEKHGLLLPVRFMREIDGHVSSLSDFLNYTLIEEVPVPQVVVQHSYPRKNSTNLLDLLGPRKTTFILE